METLDQKLRTVITRLSNSARTSKIISINAALLAEQLQQGRAQNTAALSVVAAEIQRLSDESSSGITALHAILEEVKLLTQTINLAGRQRMLSQKIMKLFLLQRVGDSPGTNPELPVLIDAFQQGLDGLKCCELNTPQIAAQLDRIEAVWRSFLAALRSGNIAETSTLNECVLQEMHSAVQGYEELSGTRTTTPTPPPPSTHRLVTTETTSPTRSARRPGDAVSMPVQVTRAHRLTAA